MAIEVFRSILTIDSAQYCLSNLNTRCGHTPKLHPDQCSLGLTDADYSRSECSEDRLCSFELSFDSTFEIGALDEASRPDPALASKSSSGLDPAPPLARCFGAACQFGGPNAANRIDAEGGEMDEPKPPHDLPIDPCATCLRAVTLRCRGPKRPADRGASKGEGVKGWGGLTRERKFWACGVRE